MNDSAMKIQRSRGLKILVISLICTLGLFVSHSWAQQTEDFQLTASNGSPGDEFGSAVSIDGDCALVGAFWKDNGTGAAYVFRYDPTYHQWNQEAELKAPNGTANDFFGVSVSVCGDLALIGAWEKRVNGVRTGAAYIFRHNSGSWIFEAELTASDGAADDYFGVAVSLSGECALVGAFGKDSVTGAAYVFRYDSSSGTWTQEAKLKATNGVADDYFGHAVSLDGDLALIGALENRNVNGSAYIFRYDSTGKTWNQEQKINASDGVSNDWFGHAVSLCGDFALVGAWRNINSTGKAYMFRYDSNTQIWIEEQIITASNGTTYDNFGFQLSLSGNHALIGAPGRNTSTGSAYFYRYDPGGNVWIEEKELAASNGVNADQFGRFVSISDGVALIGAMYHNNGTGKAYIFHLVHDPVTYFVPDDYSTIQEAIDAAFNGDSVIVRPGTYFENINFRGKAITVRSLYGAQGTTIDGQQTGSVVTFNLGETNNTILEGFTITNGSGNYFSPYMAYGGCGIFCENSSPQILKNIIIGNFHTGDVSVGGGIFTFMSSPKIIGNEIKNNSVDWGGGLSCHVQDSSPSILVESNLIADNTATGVGGGIDAVETNMIIVNNTITGNTASEIDGGGGISIEDTTAEVYNCIIWNNSNYTGFEIALHSDTTYSTMNIDHSDLMNRALSVFVDSNPNQCYYNAGPNMIDANPQFLDTSNDDFHLTWNSPCRDVGDNTAVTGSVDFEGDPRIALGTVDMGADEYYYHLYHRGDVIPGSSIAIVVIGYPSAPIRLYVGSELADPPFNTQHGDFYLNWPNVTSFPFGNTNGDGFRVVWLTVPATWSSGEMHPIQALVGPWGGPWTRFTNVDFLVVE